MKEGKKSGRRKEERVKRENIERRREKWSEAERWSVRESRLRGIERKMERKMERKKVENGRCLLMFLVTVELRGTERRGSLELAQVSVKHRCKPV